VTAEMLQQGDTLKEVSIPAGALVMMVKRGEAFLIPNGSLHLREGDKLLLISENQSN
jgi:cell volume regulation protein A